MTGLLACALAAAALVPWQFTAGVTLVEVYAVVSVRDGRTVEGLTARDFIVRDEGRPRELVAFAEGDFPLSVAIAIDRSFSMAGERLAVARSAAHTFLGELRPEDEAMLVAVGSEVDVVAPLSRDRAAQHFAVTRLEPWGTTKLRDAILRALDVLSNARGRRALVVLSDGDDRESEVAVSALMERARRAGVLLYPVALGKAMPSWLDEIAATTGGRAMLVRTPRQLTPAFREIARELRRQYLLGFDLPPEVPSGTWRRLEVEVSRPGVVVRARQGYVVP
jgi:VWFA-related protein